MLGNEKKQSMAGQFARERELWALQGLIISRSPKIQALSGKSERTLGLMGMEGHAFITRSNTCVSGAWNDPK